MRTESGVTNWVFVVTGQKHEGRTVPPEQILGIRFEDKFWGLGEKTPNRRNLRRGDRVIFYMGLPRKEFVASATLASDSYKLSKSESKEYGHDTEFYWSEYGVLLEEPMVWETPTPAEAVVPDLQFIDNKEYWYSYFQGGVRELSDHDFGVIQTSKETSFVERMGQEDDLESETEFALEAQLEEFLDTNWDQIDFGSSLLRYRTEEQTGRQFPAGPWSIDFLCLDQVTDEFVVIELKRGKTSDATVGQILRYIGWVRENVAKKGQDVRGIIIAGDADKAMMYAVSGQENVEVLTYRLDFKLKPYAG